MTRYDAHSGVTTSATSTGRARGPATSAMYAASGTASTTHSAVTPTATATVRTTVSRYAGLVSTSTTFSVVNV